MFVTQQIGDPDPQDDYVSDNLERYDDDIDDETPFRSSPLASVNVRSLIIVMLLYLRREKYCQEAKFGKPF